MRLSDVWRRIAASQRALVLALAALFALLSPGLVATRPAAGAGVARLVALELRCVDGAFAAECLRALWAVSAELELQGAPVERVESLVHARAPLWQAGELALPRLAARAPADEAERRALRARVRADTALWRRFVAGEERGLRLFAAFAPGASPESAHALVASLRARFAAPPAVELALLPGWASGGRGAAERDWLLLCGLAGAALALGVWLASGRSAALLPLLLVALAALGVAAAVARVLGAGRAEALAATTCALPALAGAHVALLRRVRAERRGGTPLEAALANALAAHSPALALAAGAALGTGLVLLAFAPLETRSCAAAGLALGAALALEPLVLAAVLPLALPGLAQGDAGSLATRFEERIEQLRVRRDAGLRARPRRARLVLGTAVLAALAGVASLHVALGPAESAERLALDALEPGAALEPALLERVLALQRALEAEPDVASASSLADVALLPALRAAHGGDAAFAVVPPLRDDVEQIARAWQRDAPAELAAHLDAERRRLFLTLVAAPGSARAPGELAARARELAHAEFRDGGALWLGAEPMHAASSKRALERAAGLGLALAALLVLAGFALWLRSPLAAGACALPAAFASALAFGLFGLAGVHVAPASVGLPALALAAGVGPAARLVARARELSAAGMDPRMAVSLAARQCALPLGADGLVWCSVALLGVAAGPGARSFALLAAASGVIGAWLALARLPALLRALPPRWLVAHATAPPTREFIRTQ